MKSALILLVLVAGATAKLTLPRLPLNVLMRGGWPMIDDERIVGGTQASPNEFPYQISLRRLGSHICGASIYKSGWIITAAHCTDGTSVGSLSIVAGEHSLSVDSGNEQTRNIAAKHEHVSYSSRTQENDICLLELSSPLSLNSVVGVVRIPAQGAQTAVGTNCVVSGWGTTSSGGSTIPDILRKVTVPIVSDDTCRGSYGTNAITDSMICAGFRLGGADSCQGDSGGPLVDEGTNLLIGVVSWGIGCADAGYYGVYTEVSYFHNWIVSFAG
ncbi:trypsin-1-like [Daphnia pulicaria]|uniref:trypsin-1-like n=1 Tax=Daphnia pulicaria TaxID=35523 RepID=UPI001EEA81EB|nr:trypsin-1-like [Daphnia pulicaria]